MASRHPRYGSPPPSSHRSHLTNPFDDQQDGPRPPSFHSHEDGHTAPRYDHAQGYDPDDYSDINVDDDVPDSAYRPAPMEMPSYQFGDADGEEEVIREGTPGYVLDEDGRPYSAVDGDEDEKHDLSYDGEDWVAQEQANLRDEKADYDDPEKSPAISFAGGFGAPPETAQLRRNRTLLRRRIKLTEGNLVLDCAIPTRLAGFLPRKDDEEFKYTAITCGPEDFNARNFTLRPQLYNRKTELLVIVTLYSENEVLFCRTMHGLMDNIAHLCTRSKSKTWGKDAWKKVVVCVVGDGRKAIHPRVLDCLSAMGVYQEGMAKNKIDDKEVQAHLYEYTTQLSVDPKLKFKGLEKGIMPTQVIFCMKELNAGKLNSHRWALEAFAPQLDPNVIILIDIGTLPGSKALYHLWKTFDLNSNVGGAAGEICAMKGRGWLGLLLPLVAAQNFEYKISNILDKPTESIFGYITVLPGAFSAYRYRALLNDSLGRGPLASYFKGEHLAGHHADVFTSNMYLAEDRILCWELVAKQGESWLLKYVKSAQGETDVPDSIAEFIGQRRRWLNGSFFASTYALTHFMQIHSTQHTFGRKMALTFQAFYNLLNLVFAWFGLANYWIFFMILTSSLEDASFGIKGIKVINTFVQYAYQGCVIASFIFSMGNKPKASKWKYIIAISVYSACTAYMLAAAAFCVVKAAQNMRDSIIFAEIIISLASTSGDPWHLVTSMLQYLLLSATYINLLNIYAFSNLHDFSWGTKEQTTHEVDLGIAASAGSGTVEIALPSAQADIDGTYNDALDRIKTRPMIIPRPKNTKEKEEEKRDYYAGIRTNVLLAWVLSNAVLAGTILGGASSTAFTTGGGTTKEQIYLVVVLVFVALMSVIRFFGAVAYFVMWVIAG
ncbi:hypothetical protein RQP46_000516 [Phenoliferia psychrophenolica]